MVTRRIITSLAFCGVSLLCWTTAGDGLPAPVQDAEGQTVIGQTTTSHSTEKMPETGTSGRATQQDAVQKEAALSEILQIRQRLGGSVLQGSSLSDVGTQPTNSFDSQVRARLGLPTTTQQTDDQVEVATNPPSSASAVRMSHQEVVVSLRSESNSLCDVANELEELRQYARADSLRATAKKLRLIARQLDIAPATQTAPKTESPLRGLRGTHLFPSVQNAP